MTNIQEEVQKIHQQYGMTEKANYKIQLLCEQYAKDYHNSEVNKLNALAVSNWVAVTERLPETERHVLILRTNPNVVTTGYIHKYGYWIWSNLNGSTHKEDHIYKVTHWMPLPGPPCC